MPNSLPDGLMRVKKNIIKNYHPWLVLAIGLLASVFAGLQVKQDIENNATRRFEFASAQISLKIQERLDSYAQILQGGAGMFAASSSVDRNEWRAYVEKLRAHDSVQDVQGIGFAKVILPQQLPAHITSIRAEGFPEYSVRPSGERALYTAIVYLEPFDDRNRRAFGFDMFSEPVRRNAMERARDTGKAALSGKVELVQETGNEVQAGTLMYVPVYRNGAAVDTVEQRRSALIGWVYSPYRMDDLMRGILANWTTHEDKVVDLQIYDGPRAMADQLLFDSDPAVLPQADSLFFQQKTIEFNGIQWLLVFDAITGTVTINYAGAWATLIGGFVLSGLLCGLILSVVNTRANASVIANQLTGEIRARESFLQASEAFGRSILDSVSAEIAVLDRSGNIVAVNEPWRRFALETGTKAGKPSPHAKVGGNYLAVCDGGTGRTADGANASSAGQGVRTVLDGSAANFTLEYPCHSPDRKRWFSMSVTPLRSIGGGVVVAHTDISERKKFEEALQESEARLISILDETKIHLWVFDGNRYTFCNKQWFDFTGQDPAHGLTIESWKSAVHPGDLPLAMDTWLSHCATKTEHDNHFRLRRHDGVYRYFYCHTVPVFNAEGEFQAFHGFNLDITERKAAQEELHLAASVFSTSREGIMITDADGTIVKVNDAVTRITGFERDELIGKNPRIFKSGLQGPDFYASMWRDLNKKGHWHGEIWNRRKIGEVYAEMQTITTVRDPEGNVRHYVALFSDITSIKEHQKQLERIAHYDALTSLPNRVLLADRLHQAMVQAQRHARVLAVAYLDLDGFKAINDTHGHEAGDDLLIAISARMKDTLRKGDTLARIGGDEFVAVLADLSCLEDSVSMLSRLLAAAAEPVCIGDLSMQVSASLGVTFYPQEEDISADQLQRQADQAMYQAKLAGKNRYQIFDTAHELSLRGHHEGIEHIRQALVEHEFTLFYQPKVNMRSGAVVGAEALIRWQHPQKGLLAPAAFLPLIEDHPLAIEIGEWVIDTALTQIETWRAAGLELPVSVNVGGRQLQQPQLMERLHALLMAHPTVRPGDLEIEVLETSALADIDRVSAVIEACRESGVAFALDDFGTGYSSLTYLKRLAVKVLKIDQSFVRDMLNDPDDRAILEGVIGLASAFHRDVIAEGVETVEHGEMLLQLGCDLAQGYGIARPMPADQMPGWVATWRSPSAWVNCQQISRSNRSLFHAAVEHRAWFVTIERVIKGERSAPPVLGPHQCRFGLWLDAERLAGQRDHPSFIAIDTLHQQVHALADELCQLHTDGSASESTARLGEFYSLCDALLGQMKALETSH